MADSTGPENFDTLGHEEASDVLGAEEGSDILGPEEDGTDELRPQ